MRIARLSVVLKLPLFFSLDGQNRFVLGLYRWLDWL